MDENDKSFAQLTDMAFALMETKWEAAHQALVAAYEQREQLGTAFWARLEELEQQAVSLGREIDRYKRWYYSTGRKLRPTAVEIPAAKPEGSR